MSHSLDLNNLLNQIGSEVASGWYQLGIAVGISKEMLDECSNHAPQEAVIEVLDYWIRNSNPSWEDVAETLNEIGLHELANSLSQGQRTILLYYSLIPSPLFIYTQSCYQYRSSTWLTLSPAVCCMGGAREAGTRLPHDM